MTPSDEPQPADSTESSESTDAPETETATAPSIPVPEVIDINAFRQKPLSDLQAMAEACPARIQGGISKAQLIHELLQFFSTEGARLECVGVLENAKDKYSMLRDPERSFRPSPDDIHLNNQLVGEYKMRPGQLVKVSVQAPGTRSTSGGTGGTLVLSGSRSAMAALSAAASL